MTPQQRESFAKFLRTLVQAAGAISLYTRDHRTTISRTTQALAFLGDALTDEATATMMHLGNDLFVNGSPLEKGPHLDRILRAMTAYGIGHITIERGVSYDDVANLIAMVARQAPPDLESTPNIRYGTVSMDLLHQEGQNNYDLPTFASIPADVLNRLEVTFSSREGYEDFDLTTILDVVAGFVTAFRREANPILALVPLRQMDEYTFTHSMNVCILNMAQGMSLGFEGQLLHDVGVAGLLHDVGKRYVPLDVLNKPGKLDDDDWTHMRRHAIKGAEYLLNIPGIPRLAVISAFEHHIRYDMTGYPKVANGWRLNLCSQLTSISDCFDALRTKRAYKDAKDFAKTAGILLEMAGTDLNPVLTLNFLRILRNMEET